MGSMYSKSETMVSRCTPELFMSHEHPENLGYEKWNTIFWIKLPNRTIQNNLGRSGTVHDTTKSGQLEGSETKFCTNCTPTQPKNNFKNVYTLKRYRCQSVSYVVLDMNTTAVEAGGSLVVWPDSVEPDNISVSEWASSLLLRENFDSVSLQYAQPWPHSR